jgi:hypothetical protein
LLLLQLSQKRAGRQYRQAKICRGGEVADIQGDQRIGAAIRLTVSAQHVTSRSDS